MRVRVDGRFVLKTHDPKLLDKGRCEGADPILEMVKANPMA